MLSHFTGKVRQQLVLVVQFYSKHCAGQNGCNRPLDLNWFFITHARLKAGNLLRPSVSESSIKRAPGRHSVRWRLANHLNWSQPAPVPPPNASIFFVTQPERGRPRPQQRPGPDIATKLLALGLQNLLYLSRPPRYNFLTF
jgi:hypothetical protein